VIDFDRNGALKLRRTSMPIINTEPMAINKLRNFNVTVAWGVSGDGECELRSFWIVCTGRLSSEAKLFVVVCDDAVLFGGDVVTQQRLNSGSACSFYECVQHADLHIAFEDAAAHEP
jgi:hypothetical protein